MRLKVKGHTPQEYLDVLDVLHKRDVSTFMCSSKRLFVSIPEPSAEVLFEIARTGADVAEDHKQWSEMDLDGS